MKINKQITQLFFVSVLTASAMADHRMVEQNENEGVRNTVVSQEEMERSREKEELRRRLQSQLQDSHEQGRVITQEQQLRWILDGRRDWEGEQIRRLRAQSDSLRRIEENKRQNELQKQQEEQLHLEQLMRSLEREQAELKSQVEKIKRAYQKLNSVSETSSFEENRKAYDKALVSANNAVNKIKWTIESLRGYPGGLERMRQFNWDVTQLSLPNRMDVKSLSTVSELASKAWYGWMKIPAETTVLFYDSLERELGAMKESIVKAKQ